VVKKIFCITQIYGIDFCFVVVLGGGGLNVERHIVHHINSNIKMKQLDLF
jgi:hypothetical protein